MATKAIQRLKATAATKKVTRDPKAQKVFDTTLAKLKKARDKQIAELDKLIAKFKKQYASDEALEKELEDQLLANDGDMRLAVEGALDEVDLLIDETFPEFLSIEGH